MTKKDFFVAVIKIFGLYWVSKSVFFIIPTMFSTAQFGFEGYTLIWILLALAVEVGLFVLLLFKAETLVRLLRLEKGFDEERIDFGGLTGLTIIKISLLIIGGSLVIYQLPEFLTQTYYGFKADLHGQGYSANANYYWAESGLKVLLGVAIFTQYDSIAGFLVKRRGEEQVTE
jgi:hypothetical protein